MVIDLEKTNVCAAYFTLVAYLQFFFGILKPSLL